MKISPYIYEIWKQCGILHCGYQGCYCVAEAFMRRVVLLETNDFSFDIEIALEGKDFNIDKAKYNDFLDTKLLYAKTNAIQLIYTKCVEHGNFFESFLKVCAETKLLDQWFMSKEFMSNV